jgi:hypothetical protein
VYARMGVVCALSGRVFVFACLRSVCMAHWPSHPPSSRVPVSWCMPACVRVCTQMKELIFRADDKLPGGKRRASVELVYEVRSTPAHTHARTHTARPNMHAQRLVAFGVPWVGSWCLPACL